MDKTFQTATVYILTHIGVIFFLYPDQLIGSVDDSHWIGILIGFLIHIAIVWSYMKGLGYFDRQNLIDILVGKFKWFAFIILLPAFIYLLGVFTLSARVYGELISLVFLSSTPLWAIMVLIVAATAYLAILGIEVILRTGILLLILTLPPILFVLVSSFQHVDWHYMFPLYDKSFRWSFLWSKSFIISLYAIGGNFLFLGLIQPEILYNQRKIRYVSFILLPILFIAVYVPLLTFGKSTLSTLMFPFLQVTDLVEVNWLMFERSSMFFMLSMLSLVFLFMSIKLWGAALMVQKVYPLPSWLVIPIIAAILFYLSVLIDDWNEAQTLLWWNTFFRFYSMFFIPALTLTLGLLHKRKGASSHG